jgi:hypothetical protein
VFDKSPTKSFFKRYYTEEFIDYVHGRRWKGVMKTNRYPLRMSEDRDTCHVDFYRPWMKI